MVTRKLVVTEWQRLKKLGTLRERRAALKKAVRGLKLSSEVSKLLVSIGIETEKAYRDALRNADRRANEFRLEMNRQTRMKKSEWQRKLFYLRRMDHAERRVKVLERECKALENTVNNVDFWLDEFGVGYAARPRTAKHGEVVEAAKLMGTTLRSRLAQAERRGLDMKRVLEQLDAETLRQALSCIEPKLRARTQTSLREAGVLKED